VAYVFTNGQQSGTATFTTPAAGSYVARAFPNNTFALLAESATFAVAAATPPSVATDKLSYAPGSTITVTYGALPGNLQDWIALAPAGSPNTSYVAYVFTNGQQSGTATFAAPAAGSYVARAFPNNTFALLAQGPAFSVGTATATVTTDRTDYKVGATVTVTYAGLPGNLQDWVALAPAGSANSSYVNYVFTNGQQSGTATFPAPAEGSYVARAFVNNTFTRVAQSGTFATVGTRNVRFRSYQMISTSGSFNAMQAGDFNGDHLPDLYIAAERVVFGFNSQPTQMYASEGTGFYSVPQETSQIVTADWNGDGKLDFLVASDLSPNNLRVFLGNGDGTFLPRPTFTAPYAAMTMATADMNGDGKADIVYEELQGPHPQPLHVALGNGDGTFQPATSYDEDDLTMVGTPTGIVTGDWNGDGKVDVAVTHISNSDSVNVRLGNGDGTLGAFTRYATGKTPQAVVTADWNRDGKADLAVANQSSTFVSLLFGNGDGTFQAAVPYDVGAGQTTIGVADFDGDFAPDLLVNGVDVRLGNADGTFRPGVSFGAAADHSVICDVNADGRPDIVKSLYNSPFYGFEIMLNTSYSSP
jgi:hypothetical protein